MGENTGFVQEKNGFALDLKITEFSDWFGQFGKINYIS